jgi:ABC-type Fe3+-hydroxamate transport system substrate-binding protein
LLGAQVIYFSGGFIKNDQLTALATMLEDEKEAQAFASFITQSEANQ